MVIAQVTNRVEFKVLEDNSILVEGANPEEDVHEVTIRPEPVMSIPFAAEPLTVFPVIVEPAAEESAIPSLPVVSSIRLFFTFSVPPVTSMPLPAVSLIVFPEIFEPVPEEIAIASLP